MIGETVSHYRILEKLGGGGMGVVYKAEDTRLHRIVALKFLPPSLSNDPEARERFVREAQAASALDHPGICTIHEIAESDGQMFIVMGYYEGGTLKDRIRDAAQTGGLDVQAALDIAIQVCGGLARAHEAGIIHRDIKPANIIVTTRGEAKILDFGLAKLATHTALTRSGSTIGTAAYMSPEQARGEEVDARSDIWSFGIVLYEMFSGVTPFQSAYEQAAIYSILNESPRPLRSLKPEIPESIEQIVHRALEKDPAQRYQSSAELLSDLRIARGGDQSATATSASVALKAARRKRLRTIAAIAAGVLALAAVVTFVLLPFFDSGTGEAPRRVTVISFENQTGLDSLNYLQSAIPNLLITSLEQSPYLRVTAWDRLFTLLKRAKKEGKEFIDRTLGAELAALDGADAMVVGTIVRAGDLYVTNVKLVDPVSQQTLSTLTAKGTGVESLIDAQVDKLSREIGRGLGLSGSRLDEGRRPIASVTTSSLEAYRHFLVGKELMLNFSGDPAPSFEAAIRLDSSFAMAYLYLGLHRRTRQGNELSRTLLTKARSLSWKAPEKERLLIEAHYAVEVERDMPKGLAVLEETTRRFPDDIESYRWVDQIYARMRKTDSLRIAALTRIMELDPTDAPSTFFLAYMYASTGRTAEASRLALRYRELRPEDPNPWDVLGDIALWAGEPDSAIFAYEQAWKADSTWRPGWKSALAHAMAERYDRALDLLRGGLKSTDPEQRGAHMYWRCFLLYWSGKSREAMREYAEMRRRAKTPQEKGWVTDAALIPAFIAEEAGRLGEARKALVESFIMTERLYPDFRRSEDPTYLLLSGVLDLKEQRPDSARARLATLHGILASRNGFSRPSLTLYWYYLLRGEILLASDSAGQVLREVGPALDSMKLFMPNPVQMKTLQLYNFANQRDVTARAHAKLGNMPEAIRAYEALTRIDPARNDRRLIAPEYHYRLARLYEQAGQKQKAAETYARFLGLLGEGDRLPAEVKSASERQRALGKP